MHRDLIKKLVIILLFCLFTSSILVYSSSIEVSPTKIFFAHDQKFTFITVKNLSKQQVFLQAELLNWQQINSQNTYSPSKNLIISPPLLGINPDSQQVIRIGRKDLAPKNYEQSYRLLLSEIPDQFKDSSGLKIVLRLSLPIFITPKEPTDLELQWAHRKNDKKNILLSIYNPNNTHKMINKIELKDKLDKNIYEQQDTFIYLLPNQKYTWSPLKSKKENKNPDILSITNNMKMLITTKDGTINALAVDEQHIENEIVITQNKYNTENKKVT